MELGIGVAGIEQPAPTPLRGLAHRRKRTQTCVETARDVQTRFEGRNDALAPSALQDPARGCDADDHAPGSPLDGLARGQVRETDVGLAGRQPQLTDAPLGTPVDDPLSRLRREMVARVSEKEQVGLSDVHGGPCWLNALFGVGGARVRLRDATVTSARDQGSGLAEPRADDGVQAFGDGTATLAKIQTPQSFSPWCWQEHGSEMACRKLTERKRLERLLLDQTAIHTHLTISPGRLLTSE